MTITTLTINLPKGKTKKIMVKVLSRFDPPYSDFFRVQDLQTEEIYRSHISQLAHMDEHD
jgi:hypothetical protein